MKQYDFTYPKEKSMDAVNSILIDQMCGKLDTNVKDVIVKTTVDDCYQNFVVQLENSIELDCEVSINELSEVWKATVREMN